jgi:hypothetical protein
MTTSSSTSSEGELARRTELARQHPVLWTVFHDPRHDRQSATYVELSCTHSHPTHEPGPGCSECRDVYDDLWSVAGEIIPRDGRVGREAIELFIGRVCCSPRRGRNEIALTIRIAESEIGCLVEMERRLATLRAPGVSDG